MACNLAGLDEWTPAVSRTGELWLLGDHRVLVADATVENDVRRLMGADVADLTFADPPYNVSYEGYTEDRLTIRGDRMSDAEFKQFLKATFRSCRIATQAWRVALRLPRLVLAARVPERTRVGRL